MVWLPFYYGQLHKLGMMRAVSWVSFVILLASWSLARACLPSWFRWLLVERSLQPSNDTFAV